MIRNLSHLVIATEDVARMAKFFQDVFEIEPYFAKDEFTEFVLPGKARIAFFQVTGGTTKYFDAKSERKGLSLGVTVQDVEQAYQNALEAKLDVSGAPKDHPWGEKSFLVIDPDGNRWEIAATPSKDGFLPNR